MSEVTAGAEMAPRRRGRREFASAMRGPWQAWGLGSDSKLPGTFFGSLSLFLAAGPALGLQGWPLLGYSTGLALVPTAIMSYRFHRKYRLFSGFFKLAKDSRINIAVSTYLNRVAYDPDEPAKKERYYKLENGERRFLRGPDGYLTGLETATTASLAAANFSAVTSHPINIIGDEDELLDANGPVICLGSPTSNNLSKRLLDSLPADLRPEFSANSMRCWLHPDEYVATTTDDYAVLVRAFVGEQLYFVCAGIDEEGTVAVTDFLLARWRTLPRLTFIQVFRCDKATYRASKLGGKHTDQTGRWVTD